MPSSVYTRCSMVNLNVTVTDAVVKWASVIYATCDILTERHHSRPISLKLTQVGTTWNYLIALRGSELELQAECHVRIEVLLQLLVRKVDAKLPYSHMKASWCPTQVIQASPNSSSHEPCMG